MYAVSYLSGMIFKKTALSVASAKISKRLPYGIAWLFILPLSAPAQTSRTPDHALWDAPARRVVVLSGNDSLFSIPLDKTFWTQLNHEKKRKKKTVRYRLARYENPTDVSVVPVMLHGKEPLLRLRGILRGDTSAAFTLSIAAENGFAVLDVQVPHISVNQLRFELYCPWGDCPKPTAAAENETQITAESKKKIIRRVSVYGQNFRTVFMY